MEIRWFYNCLIIRMESPVLVKRHIYVEPGPSISLFLCFVCHSRQAMKRMAHKIESIIKNTWIWLGFNELILMVFFHMKLRIIIFVSPPWLYHIFHSPLVKGTVLYYDLLGYRCSDYRIVYCNYAVKCYTEKNNMVHSVINSSAMKKNMEQTLNLQKIK